MKKQSSRKQIGSWLFVVVAIIFFMSGYGKITQSDYMQDFFMSLNMATLLVPMGIVQLIITATLLFKPLRTIGTLIASTYLGGAMFSLFALGLSPISAVTTLIVLWIAHKLSYGETWSSCDCGTCVGCKLFGHKKHTCAHCKK